MVSVRRLCYTGRLYYTFTYDVYQGKKTPRFPILLIDFK